MNTQPQLPDVSKRDRDILRDLARRQADLVRHPVNEERREAWLRHDAGAPGSRPMVLIEAFGVADKGRPPLPADAFRCEGQWARGQEWSFRSQFYQFDVLQDDHVIEPYVTLGWDVSASGYGVDVVQHRAHDYDGFGSRSWDPPIQDPDRDFSKLRPRTFSVNREATLARKAFLESLYGDILSVEIRGAPWWTTGMTITLIDLIGLENLMLWMYDQPECLHRLMAFLRDDLLAYAGWLEQEGLLTLNNRNDYIGSGSMGYTRDLPRAGLKPGAPARLQDLWVLSESQETVGVGPDQFEEFIFPYQHAIVERFGKCYYGCCEPVHNRWHVLKRLPNLARVSVSPWCDESFMASALGRKIVYSRKPNPALISTAQFDEGAILADLRNTLRVARDCRVEFAMKDVHTVNNEPERLARWVSLARRAAGEMA